MTLQELQKRVLQLPINERWRLVQSMLASIQQETRSSTSHDRSKLRQFTQEKDNDDYISSSIGNY